MIFKLNCLNTVNNQKSVLFFDADKHTLIDENGQSLINNKWQMRRSLTTGKKIRLVMGTKCNLNCSYCSQNKTDIEYKFQECDNVLTILEKIKGPISVIEFWGGEPLVYIKHIKRMVSLIRSDKKYDDVQFSIITNAYALNDQIVDFLIENKFRVQISYDGKTQRFRSDFDYFELKVPIIKRLLNDPYMKQNRCINFATVLLAEQDLFSAQQYFIKHFGHPVNLQPIPLLFMRDDLKGQKLTEEQHRFLFLQTFAISIANENYFSCQNQTNELACSIFHQNPNEASRPCVTADDKDIVVDIKGNLFLCQNRVNKNDIIGNLFDGDDVLKKRDLFVHYEFCDKCLLHWFCHGACRILKDELFVETCKSYFYYYFAMFCAAIYKMTGFLILEVENLTLPEWENEKIKLVTHERFEGVKINAI